MTSRASLLLLLLVATTSWAVPPDDDAQTRLGRFRGAVAVVPNNITITDKGTAVCYSDIAAQQTCTKAGVTIANGATIVVCVASTTNLGAVATITWNGVTLCTDAGWDREHGGTTSRVAICHLSNVTGATGDVVVTMSNNVALSSIVMGVAQVTGLDAAPGDNANSADGLGASPSVGTGGATNYTNEIIIAAVGGDSGPNDGIWQNSFARLNADDSFEAGGSTSIDVGYQIVSAIGTYTAAQTGANTVAWTIALKAYHQ